MNGLKLRQYKSIQDYLKYLYHNKIISSSSRLNEILQEQVILVQENVLCFNHYKSTSISIENYNLICESLNYVFSHALDYVADDFFNHNSLRALLYIGLNQIQKDIKQCKSIYKSITKIFQNDYYCNLLNKEIPNILDSWRNHSGFLSYYQINEDLSYPLVDGLALINNMYESKGTDLVLYYLRRLKIENDFCIYFKDEISDFVHLYNEAKKIPLSSIVINLAELMMNQVIASFLVCGKMKLILMKSEVDYLKGVLRSSDVDYLISSTLHQILLNFNHEIYHYFMSFKSIWIKAFQNFVEYDFDFLVYEDTKISKKLFYIRRYNQKKDFSIVSTLLDEYSTVNERIVKLNNMELEIFDLIDVLESDFFMESEYIKYYETLDDISIAVLLKVLCKVKQIIDEDCLDEILDDGIEWESKLYEYLENIKSKRKSSILNLMSEIEIQFI